MKRTSPSSVGFDPARLDRIKPLMQKYVDSGKIAGHSTLIARRGKIAHLECFGSADLEAGSPLQEDTIFRIFSMSKPVTIAAALTLYERGLFGLNDPVGEYIPSFKEMTVLGENGDGSEPAKFPVTIRQLMTHTSGLSYGADGTAAGDLYRRLRITRGSPSCW